MTDACYYQDCINQCHAGVSTFDCDSVGKENQCKILCLIKEANRLSEELRR